LKKVTEQFKGGALYRNETHGAIEVVNQPNTPPQETLGAKIPPILR